MKPKTLHILHAANDMDTCSYMDAAVQQFSIPTNLTSVHDGSQLMKFLQGDKTRKPDVLFLDINLPSPNGYECLFEIKSSKSLQEIPVIIFSASVDTMAMDYLYNKGAFCFIRKPAEFTQFKNVIHSALTFIRDGQLLRPGRDKFIFTPETHEPALNSDNKI